MKQTILINIHQHIVSQTQTLSNIGQGSALAFSLVRRASRSLSVTRDGKDEDMRP